MRPILARIGTREVEQPAPDQLAVPVADDGALTAVVSALATERIAVAELALRLPSLDEVFYALTGERAGDDTAASSPQTTTDQEEEAA